MTFEPQADVQYCVTPVDITEQVGAGGAREQGIFAVPTGNAWTVEVMKIGIFQEVLHIPDGGNVTVDLEFWDSMLTGPDAVSAADDFSVSNVQEDRTFDADTAVEQEVANVLGTLIQDLQNGVLPSYTITNLTTDRIYNANSTSDAELADILGTFIRDMERGWGGFFNIASLTTDRTMDSGAPPDNNEFSDVLGTLIEDFQPRANLVPAGTNLLVANHTIRQLNELYQGSQIMHQGDTLNAEITAQGLGTQGLGASFVVEYRVLAYS